MISTLLPAAGDVETCPANVSIVQIVCWSLDKAAVEVARRGRCYSTRCSQAGSDDCDVEGTKWVAVLCLSPPKRVLPQKILDLHWPKDRMHVYILDDDYYRPSGKTTFPCISVLVSFTGSYFPVFQVDQSNLV